MLVNTIIRRCRRLRNSLKKLELTSVNPQLHYKRSEIFTVKMPKAKENINHYLTKKSDTQGFPKIDHFSSTEKIVLEQNKSPLTVIERGTLGLLSYSHALLSIPQLPLAKIAQLGRHETLTGSYQSPKLSGSIPV